MSRNASPAYGYAPVVERSLRVTDPALREPADCHSGSHRI